MNSNADLKDDEKKTPETTETTLDQDEPQGPFGTKYRSYKSNVPILIGLALFAALLIFRQDLITIIALYQFSDTMEANWVTEAGFVLLRLPTDLVSTYGEAAIMYPVLVKAFTSAVAYFIGDLMAQAFEGRIRLEWLDLSRCWRNVAAGFFVHGPALHYWIEFMEGPYTGFLGNPDATEWWAITAKIAADQTLFALFLATAYALFLGALAAKPLDQVLLRTKQTIAPAMFSSWRFWPFVHIITYSPFMPVEFKVLWNDVAEIAWVAILSVIANEQRDSSPPTSVVTEDFGVDPAQEISMASEYERRG